MTEQQQLERFLILLGEKDNEINRLKEALWFVVYKSCEKEIVDAAKLTLAGDKE